AVVLVVEVGVAPGGEEAAQQPQDLAGVVGVADAAHLDAVDVVQRVDRGEVTQPAEAGLLQLRQDFVAVLEQFGGEAEGVHEVLPSPRGVAVAGDGVLPAPFGAAGGRIVVLRYGGVENPPGNWRAGERLAASLGRALGASARPRLAAK